MSRSGGVVASARVTSVRHTAATAVTACLVVAGALLPAPAATAEPGGGAGAAPRRTAEEVLGAMSLEQQVGQLFMVGTTATGAAPETLAAVSRRHVGNVMLTGRSEEGREVPAAVAAALQDRATPRATRGVGLFVATDQEGGQVQVLQGRGFGSLPSALVQGGWAPSRLRSAAGGWARDLRSAGVNVNLAPVLDTVPGPAAAPGNAPIGAFDRQFGYTPSSVSRHGVAFALGMADGGVAAAVKHFPGLGRVRANTDTSAHVVDRVTGRHDPYLRPFRDAVAADVPFVMMSTATYTRLDPRRPAAFSRVVVRSMLRRDLGFDGIVISDDLANARQVARWSPGRRALLFLRAGGTMVLTVNPATLPAMYDAVLAQAQAKPSFRRLVERAALTVLRAKQARGLL